MRWRSQASPREDLFLHPSNDFSVNHVINAFNISVRAATTPRIQDRKIAIRVSNTKYTRVLSCFGSSCDVVRTLQTIANLAKHWQVSETHQQKSTFLRFKYLQTNSELWTCSGRSWLYLFEANLFVLSFHALTLIHFDTKFRKE
jgi:hypothetical protein